MSEKSNFNTKVVKIDEALHYQLKLYAAQKNDGTTITQLVNKAVYEFIDKNFNKKDS